jgi:hypothetical protein
MSNPTINHPLNATVFFSMAWDFSDDCFPSQTLNLGFVTSQIESACKESAGDSFDECMKVACQDYAINFMGSAQ